MLNKRPAALMVDLDGTLVGKGSVSPRVAKAISQVSAYLPVSIATGREAADALQFAHQLNLTAPQICDGGATALNPVNGRAIWTSALPEECAETIVTTLNRLKTPFMATHPSGSFTKLADIRDWGLIRISAMDIDKASADRLATLFCGDPALNVVKVFLHYNDLWAVDFTPVGVDKGTAAQKLADMMGIEVCQLLGAGDSYNDLPMLKACGLSIAMGGASPEVKAVADYIAPTVEEDGLAVAIEEVVLPLLRAKSCHRVIQMWGSYPGETPLTGSEPASYDFCVMSPKEPD
ncbi:MAG TPA: HAD family hydrolase [Dehalococcoidia bacterium]|nr:HAD family hydrolase [Dehalococcoidia bacterium]